MLVVLVVVERMVVVERDREVIEGGHGGVGERWRQRRMGREVKLNVMWMQRRRASNEEAEMV